MRRPPAHVPRRDAAALAARRAARPTVAYPPELPVSARREEIARAITAHQVVIVCGETGSGKTTQLPKICLELDRGLAGLIGHTQPRRLAARATAARVAIELRTEVGRAVGFKIRFTDRTGSDAYIKLMTDGILLAETQGDPDLRAYDTLIIDEAHERSLNIDFLLGYLKQLLPRRPDLKVIVTSATLDADRFSKHFDGAPVIEVSGRLYPVEVRWRPFEEDDDTDLDDAICAAADELAREGPGDILVFLPGEREIREAAEALRKHGFDKPAPGRPAAHTEILPLYARLAATEQERIFKPHSGRRIVLATNVAETSLTVPGIRYVIDSGLARVKRYSYRNKVEQLQVERISQAAAKQRAGRCGRVAAGICIRLYDEEGFARRPAYTDPEIQRSSLAAVILRMKSLGLTAIEQFPFLEPPAPKAIADGYALLAELGALAGGREDGAAPLSQIGEELARLPLDPRIGRMILAARTEDALAEVIVIAAALSVQDPRERPLDRAQAADQAQKRFDDERSDFLSFLKLWKFLEEGLAHESQRKLARACRDLFLSYTRMREWRDVVGQLREIVGELGWAGHDRLTAMRADDGQYARVHRALLTGLLGNLGLKTEEGNYLGARSIKFWIHPGSGLAKKAPRWIMAAEMVETSRLYARCVGGIDPVWIEKLGAHLIRRTHGDPHWEKKAAQAMAMERGTLYGIPVWTNRRVPYGTIDPVEARRLFIRSALVEGEYETRAPFFAHNRRLVAQIEELEHKSRRPDVLVDDELIYAFYDARIPVEVLSGADFEVWRAKAERADPRLLYLERDELMRHEAAGITTAQFPPAIEMAGRTLALEYHHDPGGPRDGVTMTVPLVALNQIPAARCEWLVPGLVKEKVQALAKSLPQRLRHRLGPLAEFAEAFVADAGAAPPADLPLAEAIARYARRALQLVVPLDGFRPETLPAHLHMNFRVVDEHGRQLAMGRNLAQLRAELGAQAAREFAHLAASAVAPAPAATPSKGGRAMAPEDATVLRGTRWVFGKLEELMEVRQGSQTLVGYPALVDDVDAVELRVFDSPDEARTAHRAGLRRLFMFALREQAKWIEKGLAGQPAMTVAFAFLGSGEELRAQILAATFDRACLGDPLPADEAAFEARVAEARPRLGLIGQEIARLVGGLLAEHQALVKKLQGFKTQPAVVKDVEAQLARLFTKRFVVDTPYDRLAHYPRYLKAIAMRLDKLRADPARDARWAGEIAPLEAQWQRELANRRRGGGTVNRDLEQFGWLLEELRVALFAQELRTPVPVSAKRLQKMWQGIIRL